MHGDEFQLTATPSRGVTFSSENKNVASVSASGLVTAGLIGKTRIIATAGSVQAFCDIEVHPIIRTLPEPLFLYSEDIESVKERFDAAYPRAEYVYAGEDGSFARAFPNIRYDGTPTKLKVLYQSSDIGTLESIEYTTEGIHIMPYLVGYVSERYLHSDREGDKQVYLSTDKRIKVAILLSTGIQTATFTRGPRP